MVVLLTGRKLSALAALAARRRALGISQEDLARFVGLEPTHLSRIETGQHRPRRTTKERLAAALGCGVDVIFPTNESSTATTVLDKKGVTAPNHGEA